MAVVHLYGPKPRLSIYNVVKWSLRVNWVQYEPNLRIHFLGIGTYANTPILAPWTKFWPHGPNFDQIYQIRSVISHLGQKSCISRSKVVQFGNFKFSTLQDPQNPKLAPHGPDGAQERKKGLESSQSSPIMITDDKKSILERVNFFCVFFIWSDPPGNRLW